MSSYSCYTLQGDFRIEGMRYEGATDLAGKELHRDDLLSSEYWQGNFTELKVLEDTDRYERKLGEKPTLIKRIGKRVFISHRQSDSTQARALAQELAAHGISYWLDAMDAQLNPPPREATAVANIIEIALLNCTHVLALMTDNSRGSAWIPYEYGRVKEKRLQVENAAAFTHRLTDALPEYMLLGEVFGTDAEMVDWLKRP